MSHMQGWHARHMFTAASHGLRMERWMSGKGSTECSMEGWQSNRVSDHKKMGTINLLLILIYS